MFFAMYRTGQILTDGREKDKLAILKTLLASASKLGAVDARAELEHSREVLMQSLAQLRKTQAAAPSVTVSGIFETGERSTVEVGPAEGISSDDLDLDE
jgi:hypothetical protein